MANTESITLYYEACELIRKHEEGKDRLIRREIWGEVNFELARVTLDVIFWICSKSKGIPLEAVPQNTLINVTGVLNEINGTIEAMDAYRVGQDHAEQERLRIITALDQHLENAVNHFGMWLSLFTIKGDEPEDVTSRLAAYAEEASEILESTRSKAGDELTEIERIKQATRTAAAKSGAAGFTEEFEKEAKVARTRANNWLIPTAVFSVLALGSAAAIAFGLAGEAPQNAWDAVYRTGGRFVAIAVLFYAAVWSGRIALANMNLASVNKHRAVSLQTLEAFLEAPRDPAARDAVVLEAARAVYENVPTGYIARQPAQQNTLGRTVEVIKNAGRGAADQD